jgi:F-type H+/Na+-transporting ATPase subunit alpha
MFTRFGGISDTRVKSQIARGESIRALLTQPRFATLRVVDQVALLAALGEGVLDSMPATRITELRRRLAAHLDTYAGDAAAALASAGALDDALRTRLVMAVGSLAREIAGSAEARP